MAGNERQRFWYSATSGKVVLSLINRPKSSSPKPVPLHLRVPDLLSIMPLKAVFDEKGVAFVTSERKKEIINPGGWKNSAMSES